MSSVGSPIRRLNPALRNYDSPFAFAKKPNRIVIDTTSQGLSDILWEHAGSVQETPLLTQLDISTDLITTSDITTCVICLEKKHTHQKLQILPCSHQYHEKCIMKWSHDEQATRCPICQSYMNDSANLLDSATVHLPDTNISQSTFLRLGAALMDEENKSKTEAQANGLALLFMLAQYAAPDHEERDSSSSSD